MPEQYLEAGKIVGTHGVRGEVRVQPWCDSPAVLATLKTVYLDNHGQQPLKVLSRPHKTLALMRIDGVSTVQEAAALVGRIVYLDRADLPLEEGRYFIRDLLGLRVVDVDSGEEYGYITDVSATGANDVYHMRRGDREVLIPVIPPIVREVDIAGGVVRICPMPGLLTDED